MTLWLDAQFPPRLALWFRTIFDVEAVHIWDLGFRDQPDTVIFREAFAQEAVLLTKDKDFVELLRLKRIGPQIVYLIRGNLPNALLKDRLAREWPAIHRGIGKGRRLLVVDLGE